MLVAGAGVVGAGVVGAGVVGADVVGAVVVGGLVAGDEDGLFVVGAADGKLEGGAEGDAPAVGAAV